MFKLWVAVDFGIYRGRSLADDCSVSSYYYYVYYNDRTQLWPLHIRRIT